MLNITNVATEVMGKGRNLWLVGLGAFAMAEEQVSGVFNQLVAKGEAADQTTASKASEAVAGRTKSAIGVVEAKVGIGVKNVLGRMGVPSREEILNLTESVERLTAKVESMGAKA